MREPWFGAKRYGLGGSPRRWQGGLVLIAVLAATGAWVRRVRLRSPWLFAAGEAALLVALMGSCRPPAMAAPWRWRRGDSDGRRP